MNVTSNNYQTPEQEVLDWGMRNLALAIWHQIAKDWEDGRDREEIADFLVSDQFEMFADISKINGKKFRERLLSGKYDRNAVRRPAAYHVSKGGAT